MLHTVSDMQHCPAIPVCLSISQSIIISVCPSCACPCHAALFDTLDEGCPIDEAAGVRAALEGGVWSALGVSPVLALALDAWVTFRWVGWSRLGGGLGRSELVRGWLGLVWVGCSWLGSVDVSSSRFNHVQRGPCLYWCLTPVARAPALET